MTSQNCNFFVTKLANIGLAMNLTSPNAAPFNQVNPAQSVVGNTPNLGVDQITGAFVPPTISTRTMNYLSCANPVRSAPSVNNADANGTYTCDVPLQSRGTTAFFNVETPEPGTTALLGLALSVLGVAQTRRSKKQA